MQFSRLASALCCSAFCWTHSGATPGKMVLGLKIVAPEGRLFSGGQAVGRYFAMLLSGLVPGIGFMLAGWDERNQGHSGPARSPAARLLATASDT